MDGKCFKFFLEYSKFLIIWVMFNIPILKKKKKRNQNGEDVSTKHVLILWIDKGWVSMFLCHNLCSLLLISYCSRLRAVSASLGCNSQQKSCWWRAAVLLLYTIIFYILWNANQLLLLYLWILFTMVSVHNRQFLLMHTKREIKNKYDCIKKLA